MASRGRVCAMRGADALRDRIVSLLEFEVARKVPLLRVAWDQYAVRVPDLEKIVSGEAPQRALDSQGDTWVTVVNPRLLSLTRTDIIDGRPEYMVRYSCLIYVWALGEDWGDALSARDNLAVACRLSLLEYPNLTAAGIGDTGYRLHENTYTEQFGEPIPHAAGKGGRVWAGAVLAIDADVQETLADGSTREPLGSAEQVSVTATAVGPLQPLPGGNPNGYIP
jgi:hypothetical protein